MWTLGQKVEVLLLAALLVAGVACSVLAVAWGSWKWLTSSGLILDVAGIVQLEISGLFDRVMQEYGDEEKYPYGPPSFITRKIIHNPDTPIRSAIRDAVLFDRRTGFHLIVAGFVLQFGGVWLWQTPTG